MSRQFDGWKVVLTNMEGRVITAIGGCAILAGVAYIFQGETKTKRTKSGLFPGLVNLGNTCYFNSVLQALASVSTFVSWLNSCNLEQNDKGKILTTELSKLMQILNNPCYEQETYDPVLIFKSLCFHGWVITTDQQDAHELFQVITSTLADEVQELTSSTKNWNSFLNDKVGVSDDSIVHRSRATASKIERKPCSPFTGLFANELSCKVCQKKYPVKFDHFDTISLSLPSRPFQFGSYTLHDLMKNFICSEILESFECVSCNLENDGRRKEQKRFLKKLSLGKLPDCLCFHINRTYWQNNGTPYKNNTFVQFSETLNIHPYLYTSCDVNSKVTIPENFQVMSKTWLNVRKPLQREQPDDGMKTLVNTRLSLNTQYHLVAVIVHLGGVHNGHFITYRKLSCSGSGNVWTLVSDERVQTVSLPQVLKSNAYMLFYERNIE